MQNGSVQRASKRSYMDEATVHALRSQVETLTERLHGLSVGFDTLVQTVQRMADAQPEQPTTPAA